MKSDKTTKLFIILALSLLGITAAVLTLASWGIVSLSGFANYLADGPAFLRVLIGILFLLLFCGVVYVIIRALSFGKGPSRSEMNLLSQNNGGSSYISSEAVCEMIQRLLKKNKQIRSANCSVSPVEDGVTADIKLTAFTGGDLSMLCSTIQNSVKHEIESMTGLPVRNVSVAIVKTVEPAETKTETKRVN